MNYPLVYIISVNWKNWTDTAKCIESLAHSNYKNFHCIIIDNDSQDDSVEQLKLNYPQVEIVQSGANLGFGAGCNIGIRLALERSAEYIWLLNNDALVLPSTLEALVTTAQANTRAAVVGSVTRYAYEPHDMQCYGGGSVCNLLGRSKHLMRPGRLTYIFGASMLLRVASLQTVGLFDERFFLYWEETDLCYRLTNAGWQLAVAPDSIVFHQGSASFTGRFALKDFYYSESAVLFFSKHARSYKYCTLIGVITRCLKRIIKLDYSGIYATLSGTRSGFRKVKFRGEE